MAVTARHKANLAINYRSERRIIAFNNAFVPAAPTVTPDAPIRMAEAGDRAQQLSDKGNDRIRCR